MSTYIYTYICLRIYIFMYTFFCYIMSIDILGLFVDNLPSIMTMMPWPGLDVTPVVDAFSAHPGTVFEDIDLTNPSPNWK